jgi:hypothetical protein
MFWHMLFFLAEPPLQVILSLLPMLLLFSFESWSQLFTQLVKFLRRERKTAALANITFCTGRIVQFAAAFRTVSHALRLFSFCSSVSI